MFRVGKEEIEQVTKSIESKDLFKLNNGCRQCYNVEEKLCNITGSKYSIFMTSGQAALTTALVALGIGPGDQVIVPGYTYIATAMAVVAAGAMPVIAEIDDTLTISPEDIEAKITKYTKAIIPVHIIGLPCDMDKICAIAKKHNLYVIEDACQADGGSYKGKRLGSIGDAGAFSFNYFKIITSGEGGAMLTNSREVFERSLIYHDSSAVAFFGNQMEEFTTEGFCGTEFRANELCGAMVNAQLDKLEGILSNLRETKKYITDGIKDVIKLAPSNDPEGDCSINVCVQFDSSEKASDFAEKCKEFGAFVVINSDRHVYSNWQPILEKKGALNPLMDPFKMEANKDAQIEYTKDMCPKTLDILSKTVSFCLKCDMTKEQCDKIIDTMRKAF
ncbi:MAG: aminotransferase class I/II-fold pyridoxal phosphate-dependent enzyme [Clostridia bacterium]|nr:aminotransferase class I/II-fold pyridoxal phosphate-dependent enzyme [Clostridia bacterium]